MTLTNILLTTKPHLPKLDLHVNIAASMQHVHAEVHVCHLVGMSELHVPVNIVSVRTHQEIPSYQQMHRMWSTMKLQHYKNFLIYSTCVYPCTCNFEQTCISLRLHTTDQVCLYHTYRAHVMSNPTVVVCLSAIKPLQHNYRVHVH